MSGHYSQYTPCASESSDQQRKEPSPPSRSLRPSLSARPALPAQAALAAGASLSPDPSVERQNLQGFQFERVPQRIQTGVVDRQSPSRRGAQRLMALLSLLMLAGVAAVAVLSRALPGGAQ